jgi:hypothetical protein
VDSARWNTLAYEETEWDRGAVPFDPRFGNGCAYLPNGWFLSVLMVCVIVPDTMAPASSWPKIWPVSSDCTENLPEVPTIAQ